MEEEGAFLMWKLLLVFILCKLEDEKEKNRRINLSLLPLLVFLLWAAMKL